MCGPRAARRYAGGRHHFGKQCPDHLRKSRRTARSSGCAQEGEGRRNARGAVVRLLAPTRQPFDCACQARGREESTVCRRQDFRLRQPYAVRVMKARAVLFGGLLVALTASVNALPAGEPVARSAVALPSVQGPVATTDRSWPFASTEHSVTRRDLSRDGYEEREYFISGTARVYNWPAVGRLGSFARGPYTTRILIRRPRNPAKFSGTVIVEALNPSLRYDAAIMWIESQNYIIEHGDVYVGVTVKPVAIDSLQRFDPQRYAPLAMKNPLPPSQTCPQSQLSAAPGGLPPESSPATENGLIWDILSQTGALVRNPAGPLRDLRVSRVYLTGDSQSGAFVLIYANAIHPFATLADGKPIYDGYLTSSASGPGVPVNQCAPQAGPGDPRLVMQPRGVPIIRLINQTDLGYLNRRPDSDEPPDLYRGYEIAGAAHVHEWVLQWGA